MSLTSQQLFIDFKAGYDTIIRHEAYVGMSELNFPKKIKTPYPYQSNALYCDVLRQNTQWLFRTLWNPTRIATGRSIIYAVFQCHAGSYRTTSKPTNNRYNIETQLLEYVDDIDIVGRSQLAVRGAYLGLEEEAAKVGLKINEQKTKYMIAARNDGMMEWWDL
jgi:hypothetical protein